MVPNDCSKFPGLKIACIVIPMAEFFVNPSSAVTNLESHVPVSLQLCNMSISFADFVGLYFSAKILRKSPTVQSNRILNSCWWHTALIQIFSSTIYDSLICFTSGEDQVRFAHISLFYVSWFFEKVSKIFCCSVVDYCLRNFLNDEKLL